MANEYLVNSADMTAVADAIRTKGGTSDALTFPGGFVDAVGAIESGTGSSENAEQFYALITGEDFALADSTITTVRAGAFYRANVTKVQLPNLTTIGSQDCFSMCTKLTSIDIPNATGRIPSGTFNGCSSLREVNAPKIDTLSRNAFNGCTALESISLPSVTSFDNDNQFSGCTSLKSVDLPLLASKGGNATFMNCRILSFIDLKLCARIGTSFFSGCNALTSVILRKTDGVVTLANVNGFTNTPMTGYGGAYGGHVYVPSALIESYKSATNWSTLYAAYPEIFQPIEGSEYE